MVYYVLIKILILKLTILNIITLEYMKRFPDTYPRPDIQGRVLEMINKILRDSKIYLIKAVCVRWVEQVVSFASICSDGILCRRS